MHTHTDLALTRVPAELILLPLDFERRPSYRASSRLNGAVISLKFRQKRAR